MSLLDYNDRKLARIERLHDAAIRQEALAESLHQQSRALVAGIPMGQPILVGHHSERRHRNVLDKSWNKLGQAVAASKASQDYARRAAAAEDNTAISSDDPEALTKLQARIAELEGKRDAMKEVNKAYRKGPDAMRALGFTDDQLAHIDKQVEQAYSWEKQPYAKWQVSNLGANIRRLQDRLESLTASRAKIEEAPRIESARPDGITIVENREANRLQILFPAIPSQEVRSKLKYYGFRWSPLEKAWQRQLSTQAKWAADTIVAGIPAEVVS